MKSTTDKYLEIHNKRIDEFGLNAKALWSGTESQHKRFSILLNLILSKENFSLLDFGCGFGDFFPYLSSKEYFPSKYYGIDINSRMIAEAQKRYPSVNFYLGSSDNFIDLNIHVDYVIASGIYNLGENKNEVQRFFISQFKDLFLHVNTGFGINFLSDKSPSMDNVSIYHSPEETYTLCKKTFSSNVKVIEGYLPNDFTIFVYK
ncbi:MAG: hypothetical protein CVU05_07720 [Bacteroidetes bacterium HGW-Bacteroidetes-21]|jgi:SAM-dependent methyltransferase|nr:MAG: hypothetical protein CVU05_07720 [Bacteroidetes bacterium HGW-Bacteroidetes-21]